MKNFCYRLVFMLCLQLGFGQIGFQDHIIVDEIKESTQPLALASGDIDNDGNLDVVASFLVQDKLVWYKNIDGEGNFDKQIVIDNVQNIQAIFLEDIDNDGNIDIVGVNDAIGSFEDVVFWYRNIDGLGEFSEQLIITHDIVKGSDVYAADINNDGYIDVISASGNKIAWYENTDGLGTFANQQVLVAAAPFFDFLGLDVTDLDNDGDLDILYIDENDAAWIANTGADGSFEEPNIIHEYGSDDFTSIYAQDIDGDLDNDVIYTYGNVVAWRENLDGLGSFGENQEISSNISLSLQVEYATAEDLDNDGDIDVLSASQGDNTIAYYENLDGFGTFSEKHVLTDQARFTRRILTADLNNDGNMDVLATSQADHKIQWFKNLDGLGGFSLPIIISKNVNLPIQLEVADFNMDGQNDISVSSLFDREVSWFPNNGSEFNVQHIIANQINPSGSSFSFNPIAVKNADIDSDGDLDVVIGYSNSTINIVWRENRDGNGDFGNELPVSGSINEIEDFFPVDVDNDGDIDIVSSTNSGVVRISVWRNNGLGVFSDEEIIYDPFNSDTFVNAVITSINAADIDGDNDNDLLFIQNRTIQANNYYGIYWLENLDGAGENFDSVNLIVDEDLIDDPQDIYLSDINSDGHIDVISVSNGDGKIAWYENLDGLGIFSSQQIISNVISPTGFVNSVISADMDGDGDQDIIANQGGLIFIENVDGMGSFGEAELISTTVSSSIVSGDLDGDGDLDLATMISGSDKIIWYENFLEQEGNEISGSIMYDIDVNGCNINDFAVQNNLVTSTNGANTFSAFSQGNGSYQLIVNEGSFITRIQNLPAYYTSNPISQVSNFIGLGNTDTIDFCIEPSGVFNDLNISIYPSIDNPRLGFDTTYQLVYKNVGTTQLSGSVSFEFDDAKLNFLNASETVSSQTVNTLSFDFTDLNPFETRTIDLVFNVFPPPTTNIDDILVSTATISPVSGDETEEDNEFILEQKVIGSYDPNDITVLQGDEIFIEDADKYLNYLIRFQNTGTASAINVRVEHVLDDKLDWSTIQLESLSHTGRVEIKNETDVSFIFNNIHLPDSTSNEPESHGYIAFKIKPKPSIQIGDIISGVADIYFDFNPPIITNAVNTEIVEPLSVDDQDLQTIKLYPNPAKDRLRIASRVSIEGLRIVDMNGRELNRIEVSTGDYSLDVSSLSKGIYFLEIQSGNSKSTKKFIKH
ncbi:MAG: T9SS type A sorting domain-containing protein [Bacteroidota bacterium]